MVEYDLAFTTVLGAAFAVLYWVTDAVATIVGPVGRTVLFVASGFMVFSWPVLAGYVSARGLRTSDDLFRRTVEHVLLWVLSFGGVVVFATWSFGAVFTLVWSPALQTTFWFGMVTVTTVLAGALCIGLAGVYTRVTASRHRGVPG